MEPGFFISTWHDESIMPLEYPNWYLLCFKGNLLLLLLPIAGAFAERVSFKGYIYLLPFGDYLYTIHCAIGFGLPMGSYLIWALWALLILQVVQ